MKRRSLGGTLLVEAVLPDDMRWADLLEAPPVGWGTLGSPEAVAAGKAWLREGPTALLRVPSALVPREPNWMINVSHPDAKRIEVSAPGELDWDARLFGVPAPS